MPLPANNLPFVPDDWKPIYNKYEEWSAWYSGDPNRLGDFYAGQIYRQSPLGEFWSREVKEEKRTTVHVPIAGDISSMSADLLFGEEPIFTIPETEGKSSNANTAQDRLNDIIEHNGVFNKLVESAETGSALSGVFLKVNWNRMFANVPLLSIAQADNAIPEFRHGFLYAATFRKMIDVDGNLVYWWVERHEMVNGKAYIFNGLYKGSRTYLGKQLPLNKHPITEGLQNEINTGLDTLLVRYIPNMKPNRLFRGSDIGMSDYAGSEGLMDSLDEVFSSWMRDIRLGKGRAIVPDMWLKHDEDGNLSFDVDTELFTTLQGDPMTSGNQGITVSQFAIRTEDHKKTALALIERIVSHAGYSLQSFGINSEGGMMTATEVNAKESKSFKTTKKKQRYWKQPLQDIMGVMLKVDKVILGNPTPTDFVPSVEFGSIVAFDQKKMAETIELLNRAQSITNITKVSMVHPDWTLEQVEAEAKELDNSQGLNMPDPMQAGLG